MCNVHGWLNINNNNKRLPEFVLYSHGGLPGRIVAQESNPAILVSSGDDNHNNHNNDNHIQGFRPNQMSIFNQFCIDLK